MESTKDIIRQGYADERHDAKAQVLILASAGRTLRWMWDQPYLETCCRAALHRLVLCGAIGRPADQKDESCLRRLAGGALARELPNGRYEITDAGLTRHAHEVLKLTRVDGR